MMNNIEETYCSFETSKLLKEKGFKPFKLMGYTSSFYHPNTKSVLRYGVHGRSSIDKLIYRIPHHIAIEWLRLNFDMWIAVEPSKSERLQTWTYYNQSTNDGTLLHQNYFGYKSPQEATEAALLYTLTNLI